MIAVWSFVMAGEPSLIMIQFLNWVADRPRTRDDVMEAWRSSCPRFPVWEDACAEGLVRLCDGNLREYRVELTARGRQMLLDAERPPEGRRVAQSSC